METLYRKVAVSERLPEKKGIYLVWNFGVPMAVLYDNVYSFHEEHTDCTGITHWLDEVPLHVTTDNTQNLHNALQKIEQLEADKKELISFLEHVLFYVFWNGGNLNLNDKTKIEYLIEKHKQ